MQKHRSEGAEVHSLPLTLESNHDVMGNALEQRFERALSDFLSKAAAPLGVHAWLLAPGVGGLQLCTT